MERISVLASALHTARLMALMVTANSSSASTDRRLVHLGWRTIMARLLFALGSAIRRMSVAREARPSGYRRRDVEDHRERSGHVAHCGDACFRGEWRWAAHDRRHKERYWNQHRWCTERRRELDG